MARLELLKCCIHLSGSNESLEYFMVSLLFHIVVTTLSVQLWKVKFLDKKFFCVVVLDKIKKICNNNIQTDSF